MAQIAQSKYCARSESYSNAMEDTFRQIPQIFERVISSREKNRTLMTDVGGGWNLKKCARGLPPLKRKKLSKKGTRKA